MRLKSIKLAGFKSFVDPTNFDLPGQLIGVVGPNGCGKSNIIDAVRWVLGESRASELRGESMQDVIFNGSGLRKPSGRSSVELVFDNTDGRAQGQWSSFGELSVRRVLTRDGASSYFINNQSVRRKDIHDMFMGTGLGPRAYAIIGQGMINRIIEAKPEELRIFLEEAAGVSKYKERRKETESRLEDTRENLVRVEDILRELTQQLIKLEGQAEVASKFNELQASMTEQQQLLWLLRQSEAGKEQEKFTNLIRDTQVQLEEQISKLRHAEAELETMRTQQYNAQDLVSKAQGELYEVNASVTQLETEIRYVQDSRNRLQQQAQDLHAQMSRWQGQLESADLSLKQAKNDLVHAEELEKSQQEELAGKQELLPEFESIWEDSINKLEVARKDLAEVEMHMAGLTERTKGAALQLEQSQQRSARLKIDLDSLIKPDQDALQLALDRHAMALKKLEEVQAIASAAEEAIPSADKARLEAQELLQSSSQSVHQTEAKLNALQAIQERVQAQSKLGAWLEERQLKNEPRLWQKVQVESGWETAFEAVMRERIGALQSTDLLDAAKLADQLPPSRIAWFESNSNLNVNKDPVSGNLTPLTTRVQVKDMALQGAINEWLTNIFVAENLSDAIRKRAELPQGGLFVVKSGHLISRVGIQIYAEDSEQAGLLARAKEIESLDKQLKAHQLLLSEAQSELTRAQANYQAAHQAAIQARANAESCVKETHTFEVESLQLKQADEQYNLRASQINSELSELSEMIESLMASHSDTQGELEEIISKKSQCLEILTVAQAFNSDAQQKRDQAIQTIREAERVAQESAFETRALRQRIAELERDSSAATLQVQELTENIAAIHLELEGLSDEAAQESLQNLLVQRSAKEAALAGTRTEFEALMHALRQADEARMQLERSLQPMRDKIMEMQLKEQAARLNLEQFAALLEEAQANVEELRHRLTPDLRVGALQSEVNRINSEIQALGPVNMAALDELASSQERKGFLDAQSADLNEAIQTLTDAILKIDAETRELLQGTFDQVNNHFNELFPALFGGGNAKLVMTGEEILDSGVQVMAQPPGKKNSTIHLLSGGEKALTAIALVFSLFHLNPAPFCLLDEVDAPLDDANTGRYADIVAKMSEKTQFLFISHNKITMEIANQLIGVTMQEQGVSRIVAVDIQAAASMLETA